MFVMCGIHSVCITCTKHCVHLPYYLCVPNTVLEPEDEEEEEEEKALSYVFSLLP